MLAKISKFFQDLNDVNNSETATAVSLEIACSVLLCEVMRADGHLSNTEQATLKKVIAEQFSLNQAEVADIIEQALEHSDHATDFFQFTSLINSHYSIEQRIEIVKLLWKIAYADGELSSVEEHTIRRIGDLLHLRHSEYISTKPKVKKQ